VTSALPAASTRRAVAAGEQAMAGHCGTLERMRLPTWTESAPLSMFDEPDMRFDDSDVQVGQGPKPPVQKTVEVRNNGCAVIPF